MFNNNIATKYNKQTVNENGKNALILKGSNNKGYFIQITRKGYEKLSTEFEQFKKENENELNKFEQFLKNVENILNYANFYENTEIINGVKKTHTSYNYSKLYKFENENGYNLALELLEN